jgi:hypothetical protein
MANGDGATGAKRRADAPPVTDDTELLTYASRRGMYRRMLKRCPRRSDRALRNEIKELGRSNDAAELVYRDRATAYQRQTHTRREDLEAELIAAVDAKLWTGGPDAPAAVPGTAPEHPVAVDYDVLFSDLLTNMKQLKVEARTNETVPLRIDYYRQHSNLRKDTSGDIRMRELQNSLAFLDTVGYERSGLQRQFHEAFIAACIRLIYQNDFDDAIIRIMEQNEWTELKQEVMVVTPRRFGKTYSIALFVAAWLYSQPTTEISIFSTGRRASSKLMTTIKRIMSHLEHFDSMVIKESQEELWLRGPGGRDDLRILNCYPSNVKIDSKTNGPTCFVMFYVRGVCVRGRGRGCGGRGGGLTPAGYISHPVGPPAAVGIPTAVGIDMDPEPRREEKPTEEVVPGPYRRGLGKTRALAAFVASQLLDSPRAEITVFSPHRRASAEMMQLVQKITDADKRDGEPARVLIRNHEKFVLQMPGEVSDTRTLRCYPQHSPVMKEKPTGPVVIVEEDHTFKVEELFHGAQEEKVDPYVMVEIADLD